MPDIREYLTARQVVAIYGVERSTLYSLAKLDKIPCINLGTRLMRFKRSELDLLFHYRRDLKEAKELPQKKPYSLEPEDCYTIGEVCEKYHINDSSVWAHVFSKTQRNQYDQCHGLEVGCKEEGRQESNCN